MEPSLGYNANPDLWASPTRVAGDPQWGGGTQAWGVLLQQGWVWPRGAQQALGAGCSSVCWGLSPTGWGGMAESPLSSLGFCFVLAVFLVLAVFRSPPDGVGGGGRGDAKATLGPSPPTPSRRAVGGSRWRRQPRSLPRVLLFPAPTLSFCNMKGQSLARVFHCGFDGRGPPHPVQGRAAFGPRLSAGGTHGMLPLPSVVTQAGAAGACLEGLGPWGSPRQALFLGSWEK